MKFTKILNEETRETLPKKLSYCAKTYEDLCNIIDSGKIRASIPLLRQHEGEFEFVYDKNGDIIGAFEKATPYVSLAAAFDDNDLHLIQHSILSRGKWSCGIILNSDKLSDDLVARMTPTNKYKLHYEFKNNQEKKEYHKSDYNQYWLYPVSCIEVYKKCTPDEIPDLIEQYEPFDITSCAKSRKTLGYSFNLKAVKATTPTDYPITGYFCSSLINYANCIGGTLSYKKLNGRQDLEVIDRFKYKFISVTPDDIKNYRCNIAYKNKFFRYSEEEGGIFWGLYIPVGVNGNTNSPEGTNHVDIPISEELYNTYYDYNTSPLPWGLFKQQLFDTGCLNDQEERCRFTDIERILSKGAQEPLCIDIQGAIQGLILPEKYQLPRTKGPRHRLNTVRLLTSGAYHDYFELNDLVLTCQDKLGIDLTDLETLQNKNIILYYDETMKQKLRPKGY